jgi:hypothetical protein
VKKEAIKTRLEIVISVLAIAGVLLAVIGWVSNWKGALDIASAKEVATLEGRQFLLETRVSKEEVSLKEHEITDRSLFEKQLEQIIRTQRLLAMGIVIHDQTNLKKRADVFTKFMDQTLSADSLMYELYRNPKP